MRSARLVWRVVTAASVAVTIAVVLAWRWSTGAPLRPSWTGTRLVARRVRAAGQNLLALAGVLALWRPWAAWTWPLVAVLVATYGAGLAGALRLRRRPAAAAAVPVQPLPPRRVPSYVHTSGGR